MKNKIQYKSLLILSLLANVIIFTAGGYFIYKKGGVPYIKNKIRQLSGKPDAFNSSVYSKSYHCSESFQIAIKIYIFLGIPLQLMVNGMN